jgi:hypothetical protein
MLNELYEVSGLNDNNDYFEKNLLESGYFQNDKNGKSKMKSFLLKLGVIFFTIALIISCILLYINNSIHTSHEKINSYSLVKDLDIKESIYLTNYDLEKNIFIQYGKKYSLNDLFIKLENIQKKYSFDITLGPYIGIYAKLIYYNNKKIINPSIESKSWMNSYYFIQTPYCNTTIFAPTYIKVKYVRYYDNNNFEEVYEYFEDDGAASISSALNILNGNDICDD